MAEPTIVKPVVVVEAGSIQITEAFGRVASHDDACSLASAVVTEKSEARFQTPLFEEYVICTEGAIDLVFGAKDAEATLRVDAGQGVFLPKGLRVKWTWPEGGAKYKALCIPAFSPELTRTEVTETDLPPADLDASLQPQVFAPVDVVDAPNITISECFGNVASSNMWRESTSHCIWQAGICSLATAVVREAAEEAYQAPGFDEYVLCTAGSIKFVHAGGSCLISEGEAVFLPKNLRVKWIWPEAAKYTVVCLPGFTPELSGREEEDSATVAKDSTSMKRLEELHLKAGMSKDSTQPESTLIGA
jgi:ethanolamine utilization protein EutQ (cupin superfamily)